MNVRLERECGKYDAVQGKIYTIGRFEDVFETGPRQMLKQPRVVLLALLSLRFCLASGADNCVAGSTDIEKQQFRDHFFVNQVRSPRSYQSLHPRSLACLQFSSASLLGPTLSRGLHLPIFHYSDTFHAATCGFMIWALWDLGIQIARNYPMPHPRSDLFEPCRDRCCGVDGLHQCQEAARGRGLR